MFIISGVGCTKNTFTYDQVNNHFSVEIPIDNPREAIEYSKNIDEFAHLRENLKKTEDWYKSGNIDKREYEERIEWSEKEGDYWHVSWRYGLAYCDIQFRNDGKLKNITSSGLGDEPYSCGYEGK